MVWVWVRVWLAGVGLVLVLLLLFSGSGSYFLFPDENFVWRWLELAGVRALWNEVNKQQPSNSNSNCYRYIDPEQKIPNQRRTRKCLMLLQQLQPWWCTTGKEEQEVARRVGTTTVCMDLDWKCITRRGGDDDDHTMRTTIVMMMIIMMIVIRKIEL